MDELCLAKQNLFDCLGSNFKCYLSLLRSWFRNHLSKEEFDFEARKLFTNSNVSKHNAFLLALFSRCQDLSSLDNQQDRKPKLDENDKSTKNRSLKKPRPNYKITYEKRFLPIDPALYSPIPTKKSRLHEAERREVLPKVVFSLSEGSLPDHFMANLRMLVIVWETGLDNLSNDAVLLLNLALRDFIKNILMYVLTFKSAFRSYDKGQVRYAVGAPMVNPYLKNSHSLCKYPQDIHSSYVTDSGEHMPAVLPTNETAEHDAIFQIACSKLPNDYESPRERGLITLWQVFHALRLNKSALPSHSVYTINMEKIITRLSHNTSKEYD